MTQPLLHAKSCVGKKVFGQTSTDPLGLYLDTVCSRRDDKWWLCDTKQDIWVSPKGILLFCYSSSVLFSYIYFCLSSSTCILPKSKPTPIGISNEFCLELYQWVVHSRRGGGNNDFGISFCFPDILPLKKARQIVLTAFAACKKQFKLAGYFTLTNT